MVREHLLALAQGVHEDGECPSGVIDSGLFSPEHLRIPGIRDWLPDHHDSPAFFVLLLADYLRWSQDWAVLDAPVGDVTIWQKAQACLAHLAAQDKSGDGLPEKAHEPNDWADNVVRDKYVTYDLALHYGALTAAVTIAERRAESALAVGWQQQARGLASAFNAQMWDESKGYYVDYRRDGFCEDHLALDTLVALRYDLVPPERRDRVLDAASRLLQSRHNPDQSWGDWGVMCCFPPYRRSTDLFAKSADPYRYHNGAEWPYLSAMYAQLLLEGDDGEWHYVLTRWWERSLELGWLTPVEFVSPPYPPGAFLQGWGGMAAAALVMGGFGVEPDWDGNYIPRKVSWGQFDFDNLSKISNQE
jgi:glycogen debranching enzyme